MLLLLVRHAVTPATGTTLTGRQPGHHLSPEGRAQADSIAGRLASLPLTAVYSSPLERCRETADAIAKSHGLKVQTIKDVAEVLYGDWQGKKLRTLYKAKGFQELMANPADFRFPGGESIREAQTRGMTTIRSLEEKHKKDVVALVSHADMIRLIVAGCLGLPLDLYHRMSVGPASVSAVLLGDRVPRLLRFADSGTLEDLAPRLKEMAQRNRTTSNKKKR